MLRQASAKIGHLRLQRGNLRLQHEDRSAHGGREYLARSFQFGYDRHGREPAAFPAPAYPTERLPDDNSKDHRSWNPSRGRSYVDQDGYGRYTMQYILFANGRASLFKNNRGTYTFELETHQDGRDGLPYYGVKHLTDSRGNKTRGHTWQANWPKGVYLDAQARTDVFDKTITHAIGTTRPDSFAYNREYYYYIRYSRESSGSWDKVQIGTELGRRLGGCDGSAFCVYTKDNYVRPLPYMCGYKAPNRNHVAYNSSYRDWRKTWSWDGWGYKNEKCTS